MSELKPCPFCGGVEIEIRPNNIGDYYAICYSNDPSEVACGASTSDRSCETPEGAARRWNRRAEPGWQPISSAPRDGTWIDGWVSGDADLGPETRLRRVTIRWGRDPFTVSADPEEDEPGWLAGGLGKVTDPYTVTHWRAMPIPPVEAASPAHAELSPGNSSDLRGEES